MRHDQALHGVADQKPTGESFMRTAELIISAFTNKTPVHLGPISWPEFVEALKQLEQNRNHQK
ncbi:hypothetical protein ACPFUC_003615, partial [Vibrio cholerae]